MKDIGWPPWGQRLTACFFCALLSMLLAAIATTEGVAWAGAPNSAITPASETRLSTMLVVVDGGDNKNIGSTNTRGMIEELGTSFLGLARGTSLFAYGPDTGGMTALAGDLREGGKLTEAIKARHPAAVVVWMIGHGGQDGGGFYVAGRRVPPEVLAERVKEVRSHAKDALIVQIVDSCFASQNKVEFDMLGSAAPPFAQVFGSLRHQVSWSFERSMLLGYLRQLPKAIAEPERATLERLMAQDGMYHVFSTVLVAAFLQQGRSNGTVEDIAGRAGQIYSALKDKFDGNERMPDLMPRIQWREDGTADRFPLVRRQVRTGVCIDDASGARTPAEEDRVYASLRTIARETVRATTQATGSTIVFEPTVELRDATNSAGTTARSCDDVKRRALDYWASVRAESDGRYTVTLRREFDNIPIKTPANPTLDAARAAKELSEGLTSIVSAKPAVASPPPSVAADVLGDLYIFDVSGSMSHHPTDESKAGSDPHKIGRQYVARESVTAARHADRQRGRHPRPIAFICFSDEAKAVEVGGGHWIGPTDADIAKALAALDVALVDNGATSIQAALQKAGELMRERPEVTRWNIVFASDGAATKDEQRYPALTQIARRELGGRAILSVVILQGKDTRTAKTAELQRLSLAIKDGSGRSGGTIVIPEGAPPDSWQPAVSFLAQRVTATRKQSLTLACWNTADGRRCEGTTIAAGGKSVSFEAPDSRQNVRVVVTYAGQDVSAELSSTDDHRSQSGGTATLRLARQPNGRVAAVLNGNAIRGPLTIRYEFGGKP